MAELPTGTVTFLFTDVEGSTRLWDKHPQAMEAALARHDALAAEVIAQHGGHLVKSRGEGDSLFAVFSRAVDAVAAACAFQRALAAEPWAPETPLRVRMALHTGDASVRDGDYFGAAVNRCARLRAAAHGGQTLVSAATQELVQDELPPGGSLRGLGEHRLRDLARPEHVFQFLHPDLPADFPLLLTLGARPNNLPLQVTSFIGREKEMSEVRHLLGSTRLLTLTGTGGTGKTRLALQLAADLLPEYPDGVWLVELAPLANPTLVPQTVASVLGAREEPGRPIAQTLMDALKPRRLLLLLDNAEHVLGACATLADALLRGCPGVTILATSREGLNITGEQTYRVPSLALPQGRELPPLELVQKCDAVRLFADRAALAQPSFAVTSANASAVAKVCRRLDGIPLAIELAAARVKALPVEKINERLDDMFRLLTGGSRTALPRQQTLRALIDWSHDLLSPPERALLRRLSVFAGGWTLEATEAVCAEDGVEEWEVLDLLTSLVEKSLAIYEERDDEGRYRLLEPMRQYSQERLLEAGEAEALRERHRDWFVALAERGYETAEETAWMNRLEREHDNLRAALAWTGAQGHAEAGLRLVGALSRFWWFRGYWTEGRGHLAGLLPLPEAEAHTAAQATALLGVGHLARDQGDYGEARALHEESLAIYRELGDQRGIALSLRGLGLEAHAQGNLGAARALHEESLAISRELGDQHLIALALLALGDVLRDQGNATAARTLWEECRAIVCAIGSKNGIACLDYRLGGMLREQGESAAARALLEECLAIFREAGNKHGIAGRLNDLGRVARDQGDYGEARARYEESLGVNRELGSKQGIAVSLEGLAAVAMAQGQSERAARLSGAAEALRDVIGAALSPTARTGLGREAFAAAWAEGRAMSLDQAVAFALEEPAADPAAQ